MSICAAEAGPAEAAFPGAPGKIAVVIGGQLFVVRPDGTGRKLLDSHENQDPAWSPDGRKIAFASDRDGDFEIFVMNADGTGSKKLTTNTEKDIEPAWSADGTKIVFASNRGGLFFLEIYVMNADGSGPTQLTDTPTADDRAPAWSPDGSTIAFAESLQINTMLPNGTGQTPLTSEGSNTDPDWSPNGATIAFGRGGALWAMNANGSDAHLVAGSTFPATAGASWSPAGDRIAFIPDDSHLALVGADGSGLGNLLRDSGTVCCPSWQPLPLTLAASTSAVTYGHSVTLTAHLFAFADTTNSLVSVFKIPLGGTKTLVSTHAVDVDGDVSVSVKPTKKTSFVAQWAGDSTHPAAASTAVVVNVSPIVALKLAGFYGTAGGYKLFHLGSEVGMVGSVKPNHHGSCLFFRLQRKRASGGWGSFLRSPCFRIGSNGSVHVRLGGLPDGNFRSRSEFPGDTDHLANVAAWHLFRVS